MNIKKYNIYKPLSEYIRRDDVKKNFIVQKKQADHKWCEILIRLEFGEKVSNEEIIYAMEACNMADSNCKREKCWF